jgi:hypothetical protein
MQLKKQYGFSMKIITIAGLALILAVCGVFLTDITALKYRSASLQKLQEQIVKADRRCSVRFKGSNFVLCASIAEESLMEMEDYPDIDLTSLFNLRELTITEAFEQGKITEKAKDAALDQLALSMTRKFEKRNEEAWPILPSFQPSSQHR